MSLPNLAAEYQAAHEFLRSRIDYERTSTIPYHARHLKLDRMRDLLRRLGNPQDGLKFVHIAGSKGKGSTSHMVAQILTAAGYKTGLYTSPHLHRVEERMVIDQVACREDELVELIARVRPAVDDMDAYANQAMGDESCGPTYFEITTAMALLHFAGHESDVVVLEVGLGGRLDSTNVCSPEVAVITSISRDHTRQLGNTLAKIAAEKAGIIKPRVPVVSGVRRGSARDVIGQTAQRHACDIRQLGVDFEYRYRAPAQLMQNTSSTRSNADESMDTTLMPTSWAGQLDFQRRRTPSSTNQVYGELRDVELAMLGEHQAANAAIAIETVAVMTERGWRISEAAIRQGLRTARCPARIEIMRQSPLVIVDAAHNTASVRALCQTLDESLPRSSAGQRILIFGTTKDKDLRGMLRAVRDAFDCIIFTRYQQNPRGVPPEQLAVLWSQISPATTITHKSRKSSIPSPKTRSPQLLLSADATTAWQTACKCVANPHHDVICITGSFFLAAEMRVLLHASTPEQFARTPC